MYVGGHDYLKNMAGELRVPWTGPQIVFRSLEALMLNGLDVKVASILGQVLLWKKYETEP